MDRVVIAVIYVIFWAALMMAAVMPRGVVAVSDDDADKYAVPVMEIELDGVTLDEVHENGKDVKYAGSIVELPGEVFDNVEFKGRGNFSWAVDKKSYRLKFDSKVELLGMEKSKKWALVANYVDDSLMRNDLGQYLMGMMVEDYPFQGEFVELVVNGGDLGVYYVVRTMDISKEAVDLRDTGGVLAELDNVYCGAEEKRYIASNGDCFTVKDIVNEDNQEQVMTDFVRQYDELLEAIARKDYAAISSLIDVESFAKYFIVSEMAANPDAYVTSWFMYKGDADDKIHADLAWDYDASFGNLDWGNGDWPEGFYAPTVGLSRLEYTYEKNGMGGFCDYDKSRPMMETVNVSLTMCRLLDVPEFMVVVGEVYREKMAGRGEEIVWHIDARAAEIKVAAEKDAELWGKGDFEEAVEYLKWWIEERMEFFEETYVNGGAGDEDEWLVPVENEGYILEEDEVFLLEEIS